MSRNEVKATRDEQGREAHPAFALIGASRVSTGPSGTSLFDSDVLHQHTVRIRIKAATRKREIQHDYIHAANQLIEVELSEAQWASFVSSMNSGDGVPCTLRWHGDDIPGVPHDPRLQHSLEETREAAHKTFDSIQRARDVYEAALAAKAPAKERNEALRSLHYAIENAVSNVDYAAKTLAKTAEDVVQKARADIEAMVYSKAKQMGLSSAETTKIAGHLSEGAPKE